MFKKRVYSLKECCDHLWSYLIRRRAGGRCEITGAEGGQSHHIVRRGTLFTRYDLRNGIFVGEIHKNEVAVLEWLATNRPEQYEWVIEQKRLARCGYKAEEKINYEKIYDGLMLQF